MVTLTTEEQRKFLDPLTYKLLKPLMIADSESYSFPNQKFFTAPASDVKAGSKAEFIQNNELQL